VIAITVSITSSEVSVLIIIVIITSSKYNVMIIIVIVAISEINVMISILVITPCDKDRLILSVGSTAEFAFGGAITTIVG
jgi:hypothetical protein